MTVDEMLVNFKITAQAKGLDTYRFISDDDICVYINQAIINKVRAVVAQTSMMQYPGKGYINDNSISGTNILKSLQKIVSGDVTTGNGNKNLTSNYMFMNSVVMFITAVDIKYKSGETVHSRLVDPDKFNQLDDDYCNSADWKHPYITYYIEADEDGENYKFVGMFGSKEFPTAKTPSNIVIHYISTPKKITTDYSGDYTDIPDYAFPEIIDIAVASYFKSIGATSQQLEQVQQKRNEDD